MVIEQRRYARAPIEVLLTFFVKGKTEQLAGVGKDISLGGMFIETETPATFGAHVIVHLVLPGAKGAVALPGVVRWLRSGGMGVQFGLLGAMETHMITELLRQRAGAQADE